MARAIRKGNVTRRLLLLSLGGTLGVAVAVVVMGEWADRVVDRDANRAAQYYERSRRIETYHDCFQLTGFEKLYCEDQAVSRARDRQRQQYETAANRKAAIWTKAAGIAAGLAVFFSVVTVIAVFLTYTEQARANRIQFLHLTDARRRARQTLAHAEGVSHQDLRPYVFVDQIVPVQISERVFRVIVCLKNFGKTPARNMEAVVTAYVTRNLHKLKPLRVRADRIQLGTAGPSGIRRAMRPLIFTQSEWEAPAFDRASGVVRVKYSYTDDTGENRFEEAFDYYTDPAALTKEEDPRFFLLTEKFIKEEGRRQARQGDFLRLMRHQFRKRQREAREEGEQGAEDDDHG
jgi:hypothetical protein